MNLICTYFEKPVSFVLTDDQYRVIGIIQVPEGNACIDKQIICAISDDTGDELINLNADLMLNKESSIGEVEFDADLKNEDDAYNTTYYLTRTEIYN